MPTSEESPERLSDEHDTDGLYIAGPRRAKVWHTLQGRESQREYDQRQGREISREQAVAKLRHALMRTASRQRSKERQTGRPALPLNPGPWRPRFVPPGPKPYTREQRDRARVEFKQARKCGAMAPPAACECCDRVMRLHGHHTDYKKPLAVLWLCYQCHKLAHGAPRPTYLLDATG